MAGVEILLVEDNPNDVELTLYALKRNNLANHIEVVRDGAEALDFIFCTGAYAQRNAQDNPKVILLDLKLPKVDGLKIYRPGRRRENWYVRYIRPVLRVASVGTLA